MSTILTPLTQMSGRSHAEHGNEGQPASDRTDGTTILVVDDLLLDRRMVGHILEKHAGWQVSFAGNGVEALLAMECEERDRHAIENRIREAQLPRVKNAGGF